MGASDHRSCFVKCSVVRFLLAVSRDPAPTLRLGISLRHVSIAVGSARPGFPSKQVSEAAVSASAMFMKTNGVQNVLSLLGDDEKEEYYPGLDIDTIMCSYFGEKNYTRTSLFAADARDRMSAALARSKQSEQKIVMHCSGGEGRASLALWCFGWLTRMGYYLQTPLVKLRRRLSDARYATVLFDGLASPNWCISWRLGA